MKPVVAVIAPGAMGAGTGNRLTVHGLTVLTSLEGRSSETLARAKAAGMTGASDAEIANADFVLSILPPGEALALAERLAPALQNTRKKPVYVDCNAVSPATAEAIGAVIAKTGCPFVDAGIIGAPPQQPPAIDPTFYASGPNALRFASLRDYGLTVTVIDGPLSAASALKMSYGGITKGMTAIATAMILAATRSGSATALFHELEATFPAMPWMTRQVPSMYSKAYRWVAEMEEVSAFAGEDDEAMRDIYRGIARLYERIANDYAAKGPEVAALAAFFKPDGK